MKTLHRTRGLAQDLIVTKKGETITLWSAAGVRHTVLDLAAPHVPGLEYARNTLAALAFCPQAHSFLILGLGGGSIPRMLLAARPEISVDAVEVDPAILDLAARYFHIGALPRFSIHVGDAVAFIERCPHRYNVIIFDAYVGEVFPERCATQEFLAGVRNCLANDGVLVINWLSGNPGLHRRLASHLEAIVGEVWILPGTQSRNVLHFAAVRRFTRNALIAAAAALEREIPFQTSLVRLVQRLRAV